MEPVAAAEVEVKKGEAATQADEWESSAWSAWVAASPFFTSIRHTSRWEAAQAYLLVISRKGTAAMPAQCSYDKYEAIPWT